MQWTDREWLLSFSIFMIIDGPSLLPYYPVRGQAETRWGWGNRDCKVRLMAPLSPRESGSPQIRRWHQSVHGRLLSGHINLMKGTCWIRFMCLKTKISSIYIYLVYSFTHKCFLFLRKRCINEHATDQAEGKELSWSLSLFQQLIVFFLALRVSVCMHIPWILTSG